MAGRAHAGVLRCGTMTRVHDVRIKNKNGLSALKVTSGFRVVFRQFLFMNGLVPDLVPARLHRRRQPSPWSVE